MKKEMSGTFPFMCPVLALPVSYHRHLIMHSSLHFTTWSPSYTSHNLYLPCRFLASWPKCYFYFGPPKINGNNSKSVSDCISLKNGKEPWKSKHHCASVQWASCSNKRNNVWKNALCVNTKEDGTQNKKCVQSHVLLLFTYS